MCAHVRKSLGQFVKFPRHLSTRHALVISGTWSNIVKHVPTSTRYYRILPKLYKKDPWFLFRCVLSSTLVALIIKYLYNIIRHQFNAIVCVNIPKIHPYCRVDTTIGFPIGGRCNVSLISR